MMTAQVLEIPHRLRALWIGGPPGTSGYIPTKKRLEELGIEVAHRLEGFRASSTIPTGTDVVLLNVAFCDHMSQEAAKAEADRCFVPMVRINSQSWPRTLDAILAAAMHFEDVKAAAARARSPSSGPPMPRASPEVETLNRVATIGRDKKRWTDADREERKRVAEDLLYLGARAATSNPAHFATVPLELRDRMAQELASINKAVEDDVDVEPAPTPTPNVDAASAPAQPAPTPPAEPPAPVTAAVEATPEPTPSTSLAAPTLAAASPQDRLTLALWAIDQEVARLTASIDESMARLSALSNKRERVAEAEAAMRQALAMVDELGVDVVDVHPVPPAPAAARPPARKAKAKRAPEPEPPPTTNREFYKRTILSMLKQAGTGVRYSGPMLRAHVEVQCKAEGFKYGSSSFYNALQTMADEGLIKRHGSIGTYSYSVR